MRQAGHHYNWTSGMDCTLAELYGTCTSKEIAEIINEKYGTGFSHHAILCRAHRKNLVKPHHDYTKEQVEWLQLNAPKNTYTELVELFNREFQTNMNYHTLKHYCIDSLNIRGGTPAKKGYRNWKNVPIGTERIMKDGRTIVKVSNLPTTRETKNHSLNWMDKGRWVWEQHHGKIPEKHNIVHLDENKSNYDISNLACVPVGIQAYVTTSFKETTPELKMCAIKSATLERILEEISKGE